MIVSHGRRPSLTPFFQMKTRRGRVSQTTSLPRHYKYGSIERGD